MVNLKYLWRLLATGESDHKEHRQAYSRKGPQGLWEGDWAKGPSGLLHRGDLMMPRSLGSAGASLWCLRSPVFPQGVMPSESLLSTSDVNSLGCKLLEGRERAIQCLWQCSVSVGPQTELGLNIKHPNTTLQRDEQTASLKAGIWTGQSSGTALVLAGTWVAQSWPGHPGAGWEAACLW